MRQLALDGAFNSSSVFCLSLPSLLYMTFFLLSKYAFHNLMFVLNAWHRFEVQMNVKSDSYTLTCRSAALPYQKHGRRHSPAPMRSRWSIIYPTTPTAYAFQWGFQVEDRTLIITRNRLIRNPRGDKRENKKFESRHTSIFWVERTLPN